MRSIAVLFMAIAVTACGKPQITEDVLPKTSRVGVVSYLGDELEFINRSIHTLIYRNEIEKIDVTDWRIDDFVVASLHHDLRDRFEMVPVDPDKYDFSDGLRESAWLISSAFKPEKVADQIRAISEEYQLDALIVVHTYTADEIPFSGAIDRYGILYRKPSGDPSLSSFALPKLHFVDCRSLKVIESWATVVIGGIEDLPIYSSYKRYSASQQERLRWWVAVTIEYALNQVVADMKLTSLR